MLLQNTYGEGAAEAYGSFTTYQKAVFVNTTVAAAYVGTDFSSATFKKFYRADYGYENGIYVDGLKGKRRGRNKIGGWWIFGDAASVEFEKGHIDVDLYHPTSDFIIGGLSNHQREINFNKKHRRGTHPGDTLKRLKDLKDIDTGVSCKRE